VDVAADLAVADVYIRTLGSDEEVARSLEGLDAAAPFVRRELGKVLHLRQIPELRFREDRSLEHARRIEEILSRVLPGDGDVEEGSDDGDAGPGGGDEGGAA
jgi:ribosome-binding factor A